jgi:hypothetical protein
VNDTIAELAINRLTIIPFTTHSLFERHPFGKMSACAVRSTIARCI